MGLPPKFGKHRADAAQLSSTMAQMGQFAGRCVHPWTQALALLLVSHTRTRFSPRVWVRSHFVLTPSWSSAVLFLRDSSIPSACDADLGQSRRDYSGLSAVSLTSRLSRPVNQGHNKKRAQRDKCKSRSAESLICDYYTYVPRRV